jgi:hypothetical protein
MFAPITGPPEEALRRATSKTKRGGGYNSNGGQIREVEMKQKKTTVQKTKTDLQEEVNHLKIILAQREVELKMIQQQCADLRMETQRLHAQIQGQLDQVNHERKEAQNKHIDTLQQSHAQMASLLTSTIHNQTQTVDNVLKACNTMLPLQLMPPKPDRLSIVQKVQQDKQTYEAQHGVSVAPEQVEQQIKIESDKAMKQYSDQVRQVISKNLNETIKSREMGEQQLAELDRIISAARQSVQESKQALEQNMTNTSMDDGAIQGLRSKLSLAQEQVEFLLQKRTILHTGLERLFPKQ